MSSNHFVLRVHGRHLHQYHYISYVKINGVSIQEYMKLKSFAPTTDERSNKRKKKSGMNEFEGTSTHSNNISELDKNNLNNWD